MHGESEALACSEGAGGSRREYAYEEIYTMYIRSAIDGLEGDHQGSLAAFALWHLSDARVVRSSRQENGVTRDELVEAITHLAFYAGWPSAVTAVGVAREVLQKR